MRIRDSLPLGMILVGGAVLGAGLLMSRKAWSGPRSALVLGDSLVAGGEFQNALVSCMPDGSEIDMWAEKGAGASSLLDDLGEYKGMAQDVIVAAGVNDIASNRRLDGSLYAYVIAHLGKIYDTVRNMGLRVIAVPILPWACYAGATHEAVLESLRVNEWIKSEPTPDGIAETWTLGDARWCLRQEYAAGDGLHLNAAGQRQLARLICDAMAT